MITLYPFLPPLPTTESPLRSERRRGRRSGFTLIELLIVVAIIAILAGIAVPNLIEAQSRAKMSRCLADMQAMRVAAESYAVDHSVYPRMSWGDAPYNDTYEGQGAALQPIYGTFGHWVTTPVAYLTTFDFLDPFTGPDISIRVDARLYTYQDLRTWEHLVELNPSRNHPDFDLWNEYIGAYAIMSIGPDVNLGSTAGSYFHQQYDPTNGTVSPGNIWRSQRRNDSYYMPNLYP